MTRVVVQRNVNPSNSSQGRQSSSAPSSAATSVPSSANSSSSSHPTTTYASSLSVSASCPEDGGHGGKDAEQVSRGEDNTNFSNELSSKLAASTGAFDGKSYERNERSQTYAQGESSEDVFVPYHSGPEGVSEGRREGNLALPTLPRTSGESSARAVPLAGQELDKGKELADESRLSNHTPQDERHEGPTFADSAVLSRKADVVSSEPCQEDEINASNSNQTRVQSTSPQTLSSSSLQASGPLSSPPLHTLYYSSGDIAPAHEVDQARPNSSQNSPETVGCSYLPPPPPAPPLSSYSSRRGSWLGSSGSVASSRGGLSRRGSRVGKPSRNSPNSSRPSSPRAYGEGDGYNSADEQNSRSSGSIAYENDVHSRPTFSDEREHQFEVEIRFAKNLEVRRMAEDGNCLFRAVADQVYGDAEMYDETRQMCIDYMEKERDHFSQFVTESFTAYCKRKRRDKVYGNNLEIQAMAEMYNRPIHIYSYNPEPINIFHGSYETDLPPIRLSYHRGNHYNSLIDPRRPAVGAGLGFGSLRGINVDREQVKAALKAQQDQQIDKALLAEGRFYSDIELTEQEMERMVMEASRAEFLEEEKHRHFSPWSEATSTSTAAEPSSSGTTGSPKSAVRTLSLAATSTAAADSSGLTSSVRMLMSMGFSYLQVIEASSIFGDDVNNMLCYLLETDNSSSVDGETMYRKKGKAAER